MILKNSVMCKTCKTILVSRHRHDYQECKCGAVSLDGGLEYQKVRGDCFDLSLRSDEPHEKIRMNFEWGSYGKDGDDKLHYIKLCDMDLVHIAAIIKTQELNKEIKKVFANEIIFRLE